MDNGLGRVKVFPNHFEASVPTEVRLETGKFDTAHPKTDHSLRSDGSLQARRRLMSMASLLNMFSLPKLPWGSSIDDDKVEVSAAELESLRSEIADAEEKEAQLKAKLEHLDELLRSARLAGYLFVRTRWTALPGEPPIDDDADVDDWLPRFVVLHGPCIFFYFQSTDLSPQDSTLLSEVVEVGPLPSFIQEDQQTRFSFYILTCHGLRLECSSLSKIQVDSWLTALRTDCNMNPGSILRDLT